ncbi:MAG: trehalose-6-phosphate synthase [Dehalococcoidia bacterium]|nr:trehalose-6-phosphate synthase [Dehalococcoidia bacterium]
MKQIWRRENLYQFAKAKLSDYLFICVSNREPYIHSYRCNEIKCDTAVGGLTTAIEPVISAIGGIWIAHGSGNADRDMVDSKNKLMVPPGEPFYTLKRIWLSDTEVNDYYYGFSNQALWPLCHAVDIKPIFNEAQWHTYKRVNEIFARNVLEEIKDRRSIVFIQDYHFTLLPRLIKKVSPETIVAQFWHIPWPRQKTFQSCPWREEILIGLLGNDLLGFHTVRHCRNFLTTVNRVIGDSKVNYEKAEITIGESKTEVRPFPISVDFEQISRKAQGLDVKEEIERLKRELNLDDKLIGVSIDRLDYIKGIPRRLMAIGHFFEKYPEYKGKMTFIQVTVPSRMDIPSYRDLGEKISALEERVNLKYAMGKWKPIVTMVGPLPAITIVALMSMANLCIVSSLHDGMNLVAKEFVASRHDNDGVLLLSRFAGAAGELGDALLINPYTVDQLAAAIEKALVMPRVERYKRMRRKRRLVKENNIYKWAADIISSLAELT